MRHHQHRDLSLLPAVLALAVWAVGALASLALTGVIIWGVIRLITWVTGDGAHS